MLLYWPRRDLALPTDTIGSYSSPKVVVPCASVSKSVNGVAVFDALTLEIPSMELLLGVLFGSTSFLAAALLLSIQPMIGKSVLPALGGTPAVWNTCLVFFQGTVFCGYLLAHTLGRNASATRWQRFVGQLLILAGLFAVGYTVQPMVLQPDSGQLALAVANPTLGLLRFLFGTATLPLVMSSAIAPLLQAWFALSAHPRARDPYFLYATSNSGSLLALLAYPFAIEPTLGLSMQSRLWRTGFLTLAILVLACGILAWLSSRFRPVGIQAQANDLSAGALAGGAHVGLNITITVRTVLHWLLLLFVPSSWLMGVTTYLTTDLAPIPLFWIIPLALYLLSFVIAFARFGARAAGFAGRLFPYAVVPLVLVMSAGLVQIVWLPLHLLVFFIGSLACHGALARSRPAAWLASAFYVTVAAGGLVGGVFNALVAPLVFPRIVEYPLIMVLACVATSGFAVDLDELNLREWLRILIVPGIVFLLTATLVTNQWGLATSMLGVMGVMLASGLGLLACMTAHRRPLRFALTVAAILAASGLTQGPGGRLLYSERNFFGVVRVLYDVERHAHRLFHGTTLHGQQSLEPNLRREPSTFFARSGPIGQVFGLLERQLGASGNQIAIVGLGVGTLASYARPSEHWTFYEVDDAVVRIARNPQFFTYLDDSRAKSIDVILGDARLRLQTAPPHHYRLIVLDAFSSDAVPVHLLSREAIQLYRNKLADGGLLVFNLSNRYLELEPVMARQADDARWVCRVCYDFQVSDDERRLGKQPSIWAVMAASERDLGELTSNQRWKAAVPRAGARAWTDDYSNLANYLLLTPRRLWNRQKTLPRLLN